MSHAPSLAASRPAAASFGSPWATAALADEPDTTPGDLIALGDHASRCRGAQGRWFRTRDAAQSFGRFLFARLLTTLVGLAAAIGIFSFFA